MSLNVTNSLNVSYPLHCGTNNDYMYHHGHSLDTLTPGFPEWVDVSSSTQLSEYTQIPQNMLCPLFRSVCNVNLLYNFWTVRVWYFIFGVHTPPMMSFRMTQSRNEIRTNGGGVLRTQSYTDNNGDIHCVIVCSAWVFTQFGSQNHNLVTFTTRMWSRKALPLVPWDNYDTYFYFHLLKSINQSKKIRLHSRAFIFHIIFFSPFNNTNALPQSHLLV